MALSSAVWVANAKASSLVVLDAKTLKTTTTLAMGKVPVTLGLSPDGQFAYVSHFEDNFISVVDAQAYWDVGRVKVANASRSSLFSPTGGSPMSRRSTRMPWQ